MEQSLHQFLQNIDYASQRGLTGNLKQNYFRQSKCSSKVELQLTNAPQSTMSIIDDYVRYHWSNRANIDKDCIFWDCLYLLILRRNIRYPFKNSHEKHQFLELVYKKLQNCTNDPNLKQNIIKSLAIRKAIFYRKLNIPMLAKIIQSISVQILIRSVYVLKRATQHSQSNKKYSTTVIQKDNNQNQQENRQTYQEDLNYSHISVDNDKQQYKIIKKEPIKAMLDKQRQKRVRKATYDLSMALQSLLVLPHNQHIQGHYYTIINPCTSQSQVFPLWKIVFQCRKAIFQGNVSQQLQLMEKYTFFLKLVYRKEFEEMMYRQKQYWEQQDTFDDIDYLKKEKDDKASIITPNKQNNSIRLKKIGQNNEVNRTLCKQNVTKGNKIYKKHVFYNIYDGEQSASDV